MHNRLGFWTVTLAAAAALTAAPAMAELVTYNSIYTNIEVRAYAMAAGIPGERWNSGSTAGQYYESHADASGWLYPPEVEEATYCTADSRISAKLEEVKVQVMQMGMPIEVAVPGHYVLTTSGMYMTMPGPPHASAHGEVSVNISGTFAAVVNARTPEGTPVLVPVGSPDGSNVSGWTLSYWDHLTGQPINLQDFETHELVGSYLGPNFSYADLPLVAGQVVDFMFTLNDNDVWGDVMTISLPEPGMLSLMALGFFAYRRRR